MNTNEVRDNLERLFWNKEIESILEVLSFEGEHRSFFLELFENIDAETLYELKLDYL